MPNISQTDKQGLLSASSEDRRVVEVGVTDSGMDLIERMSKDLGAFGRRLENRLSVRELQHLNRLLNKLRRSGSE